MSSEDKAPQEAPADEKALEPVTMPVIEGDQPLTEEEKLLVQQVIRRVDFILIPIFGSLYMMSFLNRANIGNANLTGFSDDLGLVNNQYGAAVSVVYATYVLFEPVWVLLLRIITPRILLTFTTVAWAALTVATAFVKNFGQLMMCRVLLGLFEAAVIPCAVLYLTMTYYRTEYGKRQVVLFVFSGMSGAFGGLLAFALQQVEHAGMSGWQWLYLVEGLISFLLVPLVWFLVPNQVVDAKWINEEQRKAWARRQWLNRAMYDERETFSWKAIRAAVTDIRLPFHCISHFGIDCTLYSLTTFIPRIISGFGISTLVQTQLLTVPVYVVASGSFAILGVLSDKFHSRFWGLMFGLLAALLGYIILAATSAPGARFAGVFIASIGLYSTTALHLLWVADNYAGHYTRAIAMGLLQLVGNSSGACIGFIFTAQTAPRYFPGLIFDIAMTLMSIVITLGLYWKMKVDNKKKAAAVAAGAPDQPHLGHRNPHYMYIL